MAGVNWDGTEKVMEHQSCHIITLIDNIIQNPMTLRTTMSTVQKNKIAKILKSFNF